MNRHGPRGHEAEQNLGRDERPRTTGKVWFWAFLMMGPSIPISAITGDAIVPLAVIAGAALSSAFAWAFGGPRTSRDPAEREALRQAAEESAQLRAKVEDLEERLFSLETIGRYEQARRERAEEARFGAPHQAAAEAARQAPARDPLLPGDEWHASPAASPSTSRPRGPGPGALEG